MFSLQMLPIDLRIKTRPNKIIHTVLYKKTPTNIIDLHYLKTSIRPMRNYNILILPTIEVDRNLSSSML